MISIETKMLLVAALHWSSAVALPDKLNDAQCSCTNFEQECFCDSQTKDLAALLLSFTAVQ